MNISTKPGPTGPITRPASLIPGATRRVAVAASVASSLAMVTLTASAMPPPIPPPHPLLGMLVDDAGTLLVARGDDGLYRRGAADAAWQRVLPLRTPIPQATPALFDGGRAGWFLTWERHDAESGTQGVSRWTGTAWRSMDSGSTWHKVPTHHWLAVDGRGRLIGSDDDTRLIASADGGAHVDPQPLFTCPGKTECIAYLSIVESTWVISNGSDNLQRSEDGGKTWNAATGGAPMPQLHLGTTWLGARYWNVYRREDGSPDWQPFEPAAAADRTDTLLVAARPDRVLLMRQWRGPDTHMDFPPPILRQETCVTDLRQRCRWTPMPNDRPFPYAGPTFGGPPPLAWRGNALYGFDWYGVRKAVVSGDKVLPSQDVDANGFEP